MNIEIYKNRYYPELENLFSADNCNWAYGNNEFFEKAPGKEKHIRVTEKKTIAELIDEIEENVKRIWGDNPPLISFIFSAKYNPLGTRTICPTDLRYASFEELSDQEFCEFLKEVSLRDYFKSNL